MNGDGYSDVIIGADQYSLNTGRAYIFFSEDPHWIILQM
ncbi:MAG: FG-GAP repeat protein [Ignavibacteria bacterium]|nr:FG-GAP repeat protein [Ignavibacteria bacterium]